MVKSKILQKFNSGDERNRLEKKLQSLKERKKRLLIKLRQTRQRVAANSRQSDRKFKENSARAISSRNKKADQAMLRTVDSTIRMVEKKLKKLL